MKVRDLILLLQEHDPDMPVCYSVFSEQAELEPELIEVEELCLPRDDGWIHDKRSDKPFQKYLVFPGN
jgi:hypothetical protein